MAKDIYIMMKKTFFFIMSRFYNKLAAGACSDFDDLLFSEIDDIVFFSSLNPFFPHLTVREMYVGIGHYQNISRKRKRFIGQLNVSFATICASFYEALQTETGKWKCG